MDMEKEEWDKIGQDTARPLEYGKGRENFEACKGSILQLSKLLLSQMGQGLRVAGEGLDIRKLQYTHSPRGSGGLEHHQ